MAQLVTLPAIVADATDAVIEYWLVETGAEISHGQALADIETEKATVELEAESSGTLARILVEAGTTVEVGAPIAVLAEPGDSEAEIDGLLAGPNAEAASSSTAGSGSSAEVEQERTAAEGLECSNASKTETADAAVETVLNVLADTAATSDMTRVFASPLARRRARELGVAVTGLKGSGPGGRIIRSDVETAAETAAGTAAETAESDSAGGPTPPQQSVVSAGDTAGAGYTDVPLTGMRRAIARRLTESKSTVPHFYLTGDVRMDALLDFRKQINVSLERQGVKATINDLVLKALGHALHEVPDANAIWNENSIRTFDSVDISMAIATEGGLLTPVVRNVSNLSMAALCRTTQDLKIRADEKAIRQQELEGGSFSVSNLGMFGTREFSAILNPPQAGILAVGATEQRAVVSDGELTVASMMTVTFSADHRVIDGAVAGRLLTSLRNALEDPMSLVL